MAALVMFTIFTIFPGSYVVVEGRGSKADRRFYKNFKRTTKKLRRVEFGGIPNWEQFGYLTKYRDDGRVTIVTKEGRWHNGCAGD